MKKVAFMLLVAVMAMGTVAFAEGNAKSISGQLTAIDPASNTGTLQKADGKLCDIRWQDSAKGADKLEQARVGSQVTLQATEAQSGEFQVQSVESIA